ncbi:MAG TPA: TetR family transcriptional regulator [Rhodanobacter sp.]
MTRTAKTPRKGSTLKKSAAAHRSPHAADELGRTDRKQDILHSAELMFSRHGYQAVTVRDIAAHAEVPIALVGYYFGKKHELLQTIFEHRKNYITERIERIKMVDCSAKNKNAVEDIVRAWAEPVVRLRSSSDGQPFSMLVARAVWEPGVEAKHVVTKYYDHLAEVFIDTMCKALPKVHRDRVVWAYEYSLGALLMLIADDRVERLSHHGARAGDSAQYPHLIEFLIAGFDTLAKRGR